MDLGVTKAVVSDAAAKRNQLLSDMSTTNKAIQLNDAQKNAELYQTKMNTLAGQYMLENQMQKGIVDKRAETSSALAQGQQLIRGELAKGKQSIMGELAKGKQQIAGQQYLRDRAFGTASAMMGSYA